MTLYDSLISNPHLQFLPFILMIAISYPICWYFNTSNKPEVEKWANTITHTIGIIGLFGVCGIIIGLIKLALFSDGLDFIAMSKLWGGAILNEGR